MKFKVGEKVRVKKGFDCKYYIPQGMRDMEGKIVTIERIVSSDDVYLKESGYTWTKECFEKIEFEVGDIVKLNKKATIEDLAKDYWEGCQLDTLSFIGEYAMENETFKVQNIDGRTVELEDVDGYININALEFVERQEKRKMTVSQICKELGYEVEIVKN